MQGVEKGRSALIPCRAEGEPEPTVSWIKDMVPIDMSNPRYSFYQGCKSNHSAFYVTHITSLKLFLYQIPSFHLHIFLFKLMDP